MTKILHAAFKYLDEGFSVIPVDQQTKRPMVKWGQYQHRLPTKLEWQKWFSSWPGCNLGLITGYFHNRVVLDFDNDEVFDLWFFSHEHLASSSLIVVTGRGYHVHFTTKEVPGRGFIAHYQNMSIEIKACGNYVVVPPSVHASGKSYQAGINFPPLVVPSVESVLGKFRAHRQPKPLPRKPKPRRNIPGNGKLSKVAAIKAVFRVEQYLPETDGRPDARGRVACRCPLPDHDDRHKSFWYHPEDQVCACAVCTQTQGKNGSGGTWDVINLYAALHGLTNREAIDQLYQLTPQALRRK